MDSVLKYLMWVGIAAVPFLYGCNGERSNDPVQTTSETLELVQTELVEKQILPYMNRFKTQSDNFVIAASQLCTSTVDEAKIAELQKSWEEMVKSWVSVEIFAFGPLYDNYLFPKLIMVNPFREKGENYLQSVRNSLIAKLASDDEITFPEREYYNAGILATEVLAFETLDQDRSTELSDLANEYRDSSRKCDLIQAYANNLSQHAYYVYDGWNVEYKDEGLAFKDIYISGTWSDDSDSMEELLKSIQSHLDYMKRRSVLSAPYQISQTSYENAQTSLESIERVLEGMPDTENSLIDIMQAAGFSQNVATVRANLAAAKEALMTEDVAGFEAAMGLLDGNFKREIPESIEVNIGLGSITDGD